LSWVAQPSQSFVRVAPPITNDPGRRAVAALINIDNLADLEIARRLPRIWQTRPPGGGISFEELDTALDWPDRRLPGDGVTQPGPYPR
jgi:hypothetical protein